MVNPDDDRNLLFVLLALQNDFVSRDQLVEAVRLWMLDRSGTLGELLVHRGLLSSKRQAILEDLVEEHIKQHDGDVETSIVAASAKDPTGMEITSAFLPDLPEFLATLSVASDRSRAPSSAGTTPAREGQRLAGGRFRVLELHGKGGLGQVMVARDEQLGRTVAVKEIQPRYADEPTSQERFVLEAEITGGLEHPCIVPVYGLGKYSDGRPYYAMRFIRGEDLHKAIKRLHGEDGTDWDPGRRNVELHQLLRRFIDLCNAVQYAHSRGILHRDIKPANVMLGKHGETLVVDWGLAKVVGRTHPLKQTDETTLRPSSGSGTHPTIMGSAMGTPAYMSPEQAAGDLDNLGPASDVYSLGATLFCLLTGRPAFTGSSVRINLEWVKKGEFPSPRDVKPEVPRPLEAICLKAMALSPSDRYGSPRELVDDIERWIADETVSAHRESRSERLARWMRRHRTWVQAGAATLIAATAFFAVAALLVTQAWRNESAAREEAVAYFQDAREAVDEWLTGVAQSLQYYPGTDKARERLLERAAGEYEGFTRKRPGHRDLEIERGRTHLRLGHLRIMLRDATGATEAYQSAVGVFESLKREDPDEPVAQVELANCHTNQAVVSMLTGRLAEAERDYKVSIAELNELLERFPKHPLAREALATVLSNRGELLLGTGGLEETENVLRKAIDLLTGLVADEPEQISHKLASVRAQDLLGRVLLKQGHYEKAVKEMAGVVQTSAALAEDAWDSPECLDSRASTNVSLGNILRQMGDYEGEAAAYRLAVEDYRTLLKALPGAPQFRESLALTLTDLGSLSYKLEHADEAIECLDEAQHILQELVAEYPAVARYLAEWAYCRGTLGRLVRDRGQFEEAKGMLDEAIRAFQNVLPSNRESVEPVVLNYLESYAFCQVHLGQTLCEMSRQDDAEAAFQAAADTLASVPDKTPDCQDNLALIYEYWGNALCGMDKRDEARNRFTQSNDLWAALVSAGTASADHRHNYARFLTRCPVSDFHDAPVAIKISRELTGETPKNATYWNTLAVALYRNGDWQASVDAVEQATAKRQTKHGRDLFVLAMVRWQLKDTDGATQAYENGAKWLERELPHNHDLRRMKREAAQLLGVEEEE